MGTEGQHIPDRRGDGSDGSNDADSAESFQDRTRRRGIAQHAVEGVPDKTMDTYNIQERFPMLLPEHQDYVIKTETQFYSEEHKNVKA